MAALLGGSPAPRLPEAGWPAPAPNSAGKSPVCADAPGSSSLSEREVQSTPPAQPTSLGAPLPAAACASPGSDAPPAGRRALCQLATHGIDCPRLPRLERVAFAAWLGEREEQGAWRIPCGSVCGGALRGQHQYPGRGRSLHPLALEESCTGPV